MIASTKNARKLIKANEKKATSKESSTPNKSRTLTKSSKPKPQKARATVLGFSVSAVCKWMGIQDWSIDEARSAITKLAKGGEVAPSTIATALSDGRSKKYRKGAAEVTSEQAKALKAAAATKPSQKAL